MPPQIFPVLQALQVNRTPTTSTLILKKHLTALSPPRCGACLNTTTCLMSSFSAFGCFTVTAWTHPSLGGGGGAFVTPSSVVSVRATPCPPCCPSCNCT